MDILEWFENWYRLNCDGNWEHNYGIKIETLDNPGWSVEVDLSGTPLEEIEQAWTLIEISESDWYGSKIENSVFSASGDPNKLRILLSIFKQTVEHFSIEH